MPQHDPMDPPTPPKKTGLFIEKGNLGPISPEQWELPKCRKTQLLCDNTGRSLRQICTINHCFWLTFCCCQKKRRRFLNQSRKLQLEQPLPKKSQFISSVNSNLKRWVDHLVKGVEGHQKKVQGSPRIPEEDYWCIQPTSRDIGSKGGRIWTQISCIDKGNQGAWFE